MKSSVLLFALALGTAATSWATVTSCAGHPLATLPSAGANGNTPVNGCGQIDSGFNTLATAVSGSLSGAQASAMLIYDSSVSATTRGDGPYMVGDLFQVGTAAELVTALGVQDVGPSGFVGGSLEVGIWNSTGTVLLASALVSSIDPLSNSYRYHTLAAQIVLATNTQYLIGATVGFGLEPFLDSATVPVPYSAAAGFTLLQNRYQAGAAFTAPLTNGTLAVGRWGPANALATAVPEPDGLILTGIGFVVLLAGRPARAIANLSKSS